MAAFAGGQLSYPIALFGVELGVWQGSYQNQPGLWVRWWDLQGDLLLIGKERAEQERQRAEQERQQAEQEHQRAEQEQQRTAQAEQRAYRLADQLRALGIDPDADRLG